MHPGSPVMNNISGNVIDKLAQKFGLSGSAASSIVDSMLPAIMSKFINKTNDANDNSFDLKGIFSSLTGNSNFDVGSLLNKARDTKAGGMDGMLGKVFGG